MINHKELAICKQRGHDPEGYHEKWERCKYCGMWTRTIKQQREEDPPESEQASIYRLEKDMKGVFERKLGPPRREPRKGK